MLELEAAQSAVNAKVKADAKRARFNDPKVKLRRLFASNTTPILKAAPSLLKECYTIKQDRRFNLYALGKNTMLAEGLTLREIMTLRAMAAANYSPIKWDIES